MHIGVWIISLSKIYRLLAAFSLYIALASCGGGDGGSTSGPTTPATNNAPRFTSAATSNANADSTQVFYTATANDANGDALTFSIAGGADAALLQINAASGALRFTNPQTASPASDANGDLIFDVTLNVSDGQAAANLNLAITLVATSGNQPNILFIISDDQGLDSSNQYAVASDLPATPNIDALAASGVVFENLWVNPVCSPTRAALITGKHGFRTGVTSVGNELSTAEETLHEFLAADAAGSDYATALIGKWHLGGGNTGPNDAGIPHFAGITGGGVSDYSSWPFNINGTRSTSSNYITSELTTHAIDWIGQQNRPWFVWLSYNAPHTPFHLPPAGLHNRNLSGTAADINANPRAYYLAAIEAMDTEIGRLLNSLSAAERANSIVIFIGDNGTPNQVGDTSAYPNGTKGSLTEGGLRTPLLVSGPGVTRGGQREDALINQVDFFSTIAQLAGSAITSRHDGTSFVPLLSNANAAQRSTIYSEVFASTATEWAIRDARFKLIQRENGSQELYDLQNDPTESSNLAPSGNFEAQRAGLEDAANALRN